MDGATACTGVIAVALIDETDAVVATAITVPEPASSVPTVDVPPTPEPVAPEATTPAPVPARPRFTV